MNPVIRSAELAGGTRKLAVRQRATPQASQVPQASAAVQAPSPAAVAQVAHMPASERPAAAASAEELVAREQMEWRAQAKADLAAAREREEKAGHAEGYAAGHAKGLVEAQAAYEAKLAQLDRMLVGFGEAFAAQIDGLEDIAVSIGFEAALKIVGKAMATPEGVRAIVAQALGRARTEERLLLRLSPRDFYLLLKEPAGASMPGPQNVEMVPDERIELGGCLVETRTGTLDARLETQLEALRRVLQELRHRRG